MRPAHQVGSVLLPWAMSFRIHPATTTRFDDVATILAPKKPGAQGCWCLSYRLSPADNDALKAPHRAEAMQELCRKRAAPGVLAYDGDEVVGWAAVCPRADLAGLSPKRFPLDPDAGAWVVSCFRVRAGHTKQGVATALLDGAVEHARTHGATLVEAYPVDTGGDRVDRTQASVGTLAMFERAGFTVVGDTGYTVNGHARVVVRKTL